MMGISGNAAVVSIIFGSLELTCFCF